MSLFLTFFLPFVSILLGGIFILAEVSLGIRKGDFEKLFSLRPPRPVFRVFAVFFFVLAALMAGENLLFFLIHLGGLGHFCIFFLINSLLTLFILFFGIILPRVLGESRSYWFPIMLLSRMAQALTFWMTPIVSLFHFLVIKILKIFGLSLQEIPSTSDEEVIQIMDEGLQSGVFSDSEREMVEGILDLDEQDASSLMTPRSHVVFLNLDDKEEKNWRYIVTSGHSEFPVYQEMHDNIVGMVSIKSLWANMSMTGSVKLSDVLRTPLYIFSNMTASKIIEEFRSKKRHTALVVDEFGVVQGIITLKDVIESILGVLPEREVKSYYPEITKQADGSWIVDGMMSYEEVCEALSLPILEDGEEIRYNTIGGFILHHFGHIPKPGEIATLNHLRFQVLSMNHHRIDKLQIHFIE